MRNDLYYTEKEIISMLITDPKSSYEIVCKFSYLIKEDLFFSSNGMSSGKKIFKSILDKDFESAKKLYVKGIFTDQLSFSIQKLEYLLNTYSNQIKKERLKNDLLAKLKENWSSPYEVIVGDISKIIDNAKKDVKEGFEIKRLSDHIPEYVEIIKKRKDKKQQSFVYSTGFQQLDKLLSGGLEKGRLITIASRPAMGKTTFALNIATEIIGKGKKVLFFSMEMNPFQILDRLICIRTGISNQKIRTHTLNFSEIGKMNDGIEWLNKKSFYIDDTRTLENMVAKVRKMISDGMIDVIFVDYIQLMRTISSEKMGTSRTLEIGDITSTLKSIALTYNIPVVQISQVDRSVERLNKKKITLSDLSWSASLEQDSDIVIFIQKDLGENDDSGILDDNSSNNQIESVMEFVDNEETRDVIVDVAKNRDGATGSIPFVFKAPSYTFEEKINM